MLSPTAPLRMQRLFWIGSPFFARDLRHHGFEVSVYNFESQNLHTWDDIVRLAGWEPDVVVVADKSRPPFVLGMERFPCHTVFYAVDTHIHSWYPLYAQGFDACIVSLRDHLPLMLERRLSPEQVLWSPAFAPNSPAPQPQSPEFECLFVGNVNPDTTPQRRIFLQALAMMVPLTIRQGNYRDLYAKARVVLNFCEHGDLNFRVFETLGCGNCLVTPAVGHGQNDLFTPGVHFLDYTPHDVDSAAEAVRTALHNPSLCALLGHNGLEAVENGHRSAHRAAAFNEFIRGLPADLPQRRLAESDAVCRDWLRRLYLHHAECNTTPALREAYLRASMGQV